MTPACHVHKAAPCVADLVTLNALPLSPPAGCERHNSSQREEQQIFHIMNAEGTCSHTENLYCGNIQTVDGASLSMQVIRDYR